MTILSCLNHVLKTHCRYDASASTLENTTKKTTKRKPHAAFHGNAYEFQEIFACR